MEGIFIPLSIREGANGAFTFSVVEWGQFVLPEMVSAGVARFFSVTEVLCEFSFLSVTQIVN
ncbi:hypothetical protein [Aeromonas veronii]|uniref:hypothetical protein n=1 Tax=Aeromonas veronii TaxID=654 RepID=UPI0035BA7098